MLGGAVVGAKRNTACGLLNLQWCAFLLLNSSDIGSHFHEFEGILFRGGRESPIKRDERDFVSVSHAERTSGNGSAVRDGVHADTGFLGDPFEVVSAGRLPVALPCADKALGDS